MAQPRQAPRRGVLLLRMSERSIRFAIFFLGLGWAVAAGSFWLNLRYRLDVFGRSGSVVVLCAVVVEYQLLNAKDAYHGRQLTDHVDGADVDFEATHPRQVHRYVEAVAHLTMILGTLIWGYGDLVFG